MYTHARTPRRIHRFGVLLCMLSTALACKVHAQAQQPAAPAAGPAQCLPAGNGYLRARLSGAMSTELNWGNDGTECTGAVRPTDGGIRMRFSRPDGPGKLVLVFGIAQLAEGKSARNVPVNVTLIREGAGQFFSTQGDTLCRSCFAALSPARVRPAGRTARSAGAAPPGIAYRESPPPLPVCRSVKNA